MSDALSLVALVVCFAHVSIMRSHHDEKRVLDLMDLCEELITARERQDFKEELRIYQKKIRLAYRYRPEPRLEPEPD